MGKPIKTEIGIQTVANYLDERVVPVFAQHFAVTVTNDSQNRTVCTCAYVANCHRRIKRSLNSFIQASCFVTVSRSFAPLPLVDCLGIGQIHTESSPPSGNDGKCAGSIIAMATETAQSSTARANRISESCSV
jgi:hypothetical protein